MTTRILVLAGVLLTGTAAGWLAANRFSVTETVAEAPVAHGVTHEKLAGPGPNHTTVGELPTTLIIASPSGKDDAAAFEPKTDVSLQLEEMLERETAQRRLLERRLQELTDKVASLEQAIPAGSRAVPAQTGVAMAGGGDHAAEPETHAARREARFLAAGFDTEETQALTQRMEEVEMDQLYLRDRARREGWLRTPEYRRARNELRNQLQEEMGEDAYDRFLYATERSNRVLVDSVLQDSPAQEIGVQTGDIILGYDEKRVFSFYDLRRESARGTAGDPVALRVERNGEVLELEIPRGPLGVRLDSLSVIPNQSGIDTEQASGHRRRRRL